MNQKQKTNHATVGKRPDSLSHPALAAGRIGHAEEPPDRSEGGFSSVLRAILAPVAAAVATALLSVTALAALAGNTPDPASLVPWLSAAALALSSLAGGITAGLCKRESAVLRGLLWGVLLSALLYVVGFAAGDIGGAAECLLRIIPIPVSALGGVLTRPRRSRPAHRAGNHPARAR